MTNTAASRPPTDRSAYDHWTSDVVRFSDQNVEGHVNSVAIAGYVEAGRVSFGQELKRAAGPGSVLMLVRLAIDYLVEAHYPGRIEVGTRLLGVGRSSMTLGHGVFKDGECIATAEAVLVYTENGVSKPVEDKFRAHLEKLACASS